MINTESDDMMRLTRAQKAAAKKAEKRRIEKEAFLQLVEKMHQEREAAEAIQRAEDRRFWVAQRAALLHLGRHAPVQSGRKTFVHAGCVATILGLLDKGNYNRDALLRVMRIDYNYSYRHAGFLLGQLCGPDVEQHLWFVDAERCYRLHNSTVPTERALAA